MKVKMMVGLSGPALLLNPGDECEFPKDEALRLIQAGIAVAAEQQDVETATVEPVVEKRPGRKRRG